MYEGFQKGEGDKIRFKQGTKCPPPSPSLNALLVTSPCYFFSWPSSLASLIMLVHTCSESEIKAPVCTVTTCLGAELAIVVWFWEATIHPHRSTHPPADSHSALCLDCKLISLVL